MEAMIASVDLQLVEAVLVKMNGVEGAKRFLRGDLTLVEQLKPLPTPEVWTEADRQWWLGILFGNK